MASINGPESPLKDLLPSRVRLIAYAVVSVAALVFGLYQAADGNWETFIGSLLTAGVTLLAAGNVSSPDSHLKDEDTGDSLPGLNFNPVTYHLGEGPEASDAARVHDQSRRYEDPFEDDEFEDTQRDPHNR